MKHANLVLAALALFAMGQAPPASKGGTIAGTVVAVRGGKPVKNKDDLQYVRVFLEPIVPLRRPGAGMRFQIVQSQTQFSPHVLVVPLGATVSFPNADNERHSVFSPKIANLWEGFDLGEWSKGDGGKAQTFWTPGEYDIYCNLHMDMWAKVKVVPSPYWSEIDVKTGRFSIGNVPPGTYRVRAWTMNSNDVVSEKVVIAGEETKDVLELHVQIGSRPKVHPRVDGSPYEIYRK